MINPWVLLLIELPLFMVLTWLYWQFPQNRQRGKSQLIFDLLVIALALIGTLLALSFSVDEHAHVYGNIWPQVLAALVAYHIYPIALAIAWFWRARIFRHA